MASPIDPPTGETPLTTAPTWSGTGGGTQAQQVYAWNAFVQQFGRNPTQSELTSLSPYYASGDQNIANTSQGNQAIAQYFQQLQNSPSAINTRQQQQQTANYTGNQSQYDAQTNQLFQQYLGRDATSAELQHFGTALANGSDPYEVQQSLMQTPEYQNAQTQKESDQLKGTLQQSNSDYFNQYILPSIQASNAQAGRSQDSSGYAGALAQAAKQQNFDLNNYLANFQAGQYGQNVQNAAANYQPYLQQQYGLQQANVSNTLQNNAYNTQRSNQLQDYYNQQNAYNSYLQNYGKRSAYDYAQLGIGALQGGGQAAGGAGALLAAI